MHLSMSSPRGGGVGQPTGIWLWCVSPGWGFWSFDRSITKRRREENHTFDHYFLPGGGDFDNFFSNVKILTLCPTPPPLLSGLTLIGALLLPERPRDPEGPLAPFCVAPSSIQVKRLFVMNTVEGRILWSQWQFLPLAPSPPRPPRSRKKKLSLTLTLIIVFNNCIKPGFHYHISARRRKSITQARTHGQKGDCLIVGSIPPRCSKTRCRTMSMLMLTAARSHVT